MRTSILTLISIAALLVSSTALAQEVAPGPAERAWNPEQTQKRFGRRGRRGRGHRGRLLARPAMLKEKLGLSDAQVVQLRSIRDQLRTRTTGYRSQIRKLRQQMRVLIQSEPLDGPMITIVHRQMRNLRGKMAEERFSSRLQALGVLTKDQREKLFDGAKKRRQRLHGVWAR